MKQNNQKKTNIMFIIDFLYGFSGGGTERHLLNLVKHINYAYFRLVIVAFDTGDSPLVRSIKNSGSDIIHVPIGRYYTPYAFKKTFELAKLIKSMKIDIVQTYHIKSDIIGVLAAKIAGVKHIISSRRDVGDQKKVIHLVLNRQINRFVNGFIVVADKVGEVIVERETVPVKKIKTIYNGVDIKKFTPPSSDEKKSIRERLGLYEDDFVVGMVAVFRPEKNHDIFFKALKHVISKNKKIKAVVVGNGPLFNHYQEHCKKINIADQIVFAGAVENVKKYLQAMDIACLVPGSNEGFSNSIIEKMAMGLPLVVTDIGGNSEAVIDGVNGIVVPPYDSDAVSDAILQLYENLNKRNKMGNKSRERVEKYFSLQHMIENYEKYYENLLMGATDF